MYPYEEWFHLPFIGKVAGRRNVLQTLLSAGKD